MNVKLGICFYVLKGNWAKSPLMQLEMIKALLLWKDASQILRESRFAAWKEGM